MTSAQTRTPDLPPVAANLKIAMALFMIVLLTTAVTAVLYLSERMVTRVEAATRPVPSFGNPADHQTPPILIITAPTVAAPVPREAPVTKANPPAGKAAPSVKPPVLARVEGKAKSAPAPAVVSPALGEEEESAVEESQPEQAVSGLFWQVVATDLPRAELTRELLRRAGVDSSVITGPSDRVFRVVVGPLSSEKAIRDTRAALAAEGFRPFMRHF